MKPASGRAAPGAEKGASTRRLSGRDARTLAPSLAVGHPAFVFAIAIVAACIVIDASFRLYDTDMWQHLAVGRAIWQLHQVPTRQLWTWPTYGAPDVNASWGFRALIWPIWQAFGVPGLFAWRWITSLVVFGFVWSATRRMGATGLAPLFAIAWCAVTYRQRSHVRPETLVSVLLAAQLWIHESWRARARWTGTRIGAESPAPRMPGDHRLGLIVISCMWANVHISYWMGLAIQFIYWIGDWPSSRTPVAFLLERLGLRGWRAPAAILGASAAVSFVNPWGWRALWQPFEYYLYWRHEPIFKTIGELVPLDWSFNQRNLLPALLAVAVALPLWRAWRREFDRVEWLMLGLFMPLAIATQRFLGFLAVMMAMFLGRDLDEFARSRGWRPSTAGTTPAEKRVESDVAWPWARALSIALLCVVVSVPEWTRTSMPLGVAIDWRSVPVRACDFVAEHGVRGRGMNQFAEGGYQVYRFWPDRSRLPFMDIHQAGTREDRLLYAYAQQDSAAWRMLDNKYRFDYVLLFTHQYPNDHLIDRLGADSTHWALVFSDDAGSLFLRRDGPFAELANQYRYQVLPAGNQDLIPSLNAAAEDSSKRRRLEGEFERSARASSLNSRAKIALAFLADAEGREVAARQILNEVIHDDPFAVHAHEYRAEIELGAGEARAAIADLEREARIQIESAGLNVKLGRAWQAAGDGTRARDRYRRALRLEPGNQAARDSLARLERAAAR